MPENEKSKFHYSENYSHSSLDAKQPEDIKQLLEFEEKYILKKNTANHESVKNKECEFPEKNAKEAVKDNKRKNKNEKNLFNK